MNQANVAIPANASEGFKAGATTDTKTHQWLGRHGAWLRALLVALVTAFLVELVIFNQTALFFDEEAYPHQVVPLPQHQGLGKPAFVVSAQQNSVSLQLPDVPLKSVYLRLAHGPRYLVQGKLELRTFSAAYMWSPVGAFSLTGSGQDETSEAYFKILPKGNVKELRLSFEPKTVVSGVAIVALELNKPVPLDLKPLRIVLLALVLAFAWSVVKGSWRQGRVIVGSRRYRRITRSCLCLMLLGAVALFYATSPYVATEGGFKFIGEGYLPYNTPNHDLLVPLPQTPQEYAAHDEYIQMLAAYTKGQLHLPYPADPRLEQVTNVYDNSELFAKEIPFLWDHAYHEGKYYVYFGVAPLFTIYFPIYLVTGEAPCAALAAFIATVYALLALYFGVTRLISSVLRSVNPLLLSLALVTMALASGVFMMQGMLVFYILPYLLAFAALGVTLGTATRLYTLVRLERLSSKSCALESYRARLIKRCRGQAYGELVVLGLAIVAMVTSRPLNLFYLVVILVPVLWWYLRSTGAWRCKAGAALCAGVPVTLGAILVMWYNYARFGSIFEFGQFEQLTLFDTHYHELHLNFELFWSVLYHYFCENFNLIATFPYVTLASGIDLNMGNGTGFSPIGGLLFFPFFWTLPLLVVLYRKVKARRSVIRGVSGPEFNPATYWREQQQRRSYQQALVLGLGLAVASVPLVMIAVGINAGLCIRYLCDALMLCAPLAVIACLHFDYADAKVGAADQAVEDAVVDDGAVHRAVFYWAIVACCLFTCWAMFFVTFSASEHFSSINPELMIELKRFFDPLSFT